MEDNKKYFDELVEVKYSGIHGYGIFSAGFIPKEKIIMKISGEVIDLNECVKREEEGNVYIFWNGDNYIDVINSEKIRYTNHHCDPNCTVIDGDFESLYLFSIKDIKPGEEITIDYGYEEIYQECKCSICLVGNPI